MGRDCGPLSGGLRAAAIGAAAVPGADWIVFSPPGSRAAEPPVPTSLWYPSFCPSHTQFQSDNWPQRDPKSFQLCRFRSPGSHPPSSCTPVNGFLPPTLLCLVIRCNFFKSPLSLPQIQGLQEERAGRGSAAGLFAFCLFSLLHVYECQAEKVPLSALLVRAGSPSHLWLGPPESSDHIAVCLPTSSRRALAWVWFPQKWTQNIWRGSQKTQGRGSRTWSLKLAL